MGNSIKNRRRQAQIKEYAEPRGLYEQCAWDRRFIRKEILSGKLAPCFPGEEGSANHEIGTNERLKDKLGFGDLEECPICLLFYPGGLNRMTCCKQSMCTECYLQVKQPPVNLLTPRSRCPFCKSDKFDHVYTGPLSTEQKKAQDVEQQKVLELQIKMQSEERKKDLERQQQRAKAADGTDDTKKSAEDNKKVQTTRSTSFSLSSSVPETDQPETGVDTDLVGTGPGISSEAGGEVAMSGGGGGGEYDMTDIEQMMIEEALRRSLMDSKGIQEGTGIGMGGGGGESGVVSSSIDVQNQNSLDAKLHMAPPDGDESDDDIPEEGEDLNQAILLSLELHSASASASSSSIASSLT